jgi:hypothetical protein
MKIQMKLSLMIVLFLTGLTGLIIGFDYLQAKEGKIRKMNLSNRDTVDLYTGLFNGPALYLFCVSYYSY